jgi:hypothetical protein
MIDDRDNSASFDLTVEVGNYFGLVEDEHEEMVRAQRFLRSVM